MLADDGLPRYVWEPVPTTEAEYATTVLLSIKLEGYRPGPVEFAGMVLCLASVAWALREALWEYSRAVVNSERPPQAAADHIARVAALDGQETFAFSDGDHVTVHYHVRRWPGDSGWAVMDLFRIEDGMIAEHWDVIEPIPPSTTIARESAPSRRWSGVRGAQ